MEGGRRVRVEGRAAASERMVVAAEAGDEEEEVGGGGDGGGIGRRDRGMQRARKRGRACDEVGRNYNEWCARGRAG